MTGLEQQQMLLSYPDAYSDINPTGTITADAYKQWRWTTFWNYIRL